MAIETVHLRLLPYSPAHLLALIEGHRQFEEQFGLRAAVGLRDFIMSDEVSPAWLARLRASAAADPWVHGFAVVHRESRSVIGCASFKGPPDEEGVVEIAYGIVSGYQGRGHATEAAAALVAFAFGSGRVSLVRAHTLPTPNASTRVLAKCGSNAWVKSRTRRMVWCGSGSEPRSRPDPPHVKIDHGVLVHTEASWDGELARVRAAILQPLPDAALRA